MSVTVHAIPWIVPYMFVCHTHDRVIYATNAYKSGAILNIAAKIRYLSLKSDFKKWIILGYWDSQFLFLRQAWTQNYGGYYLVSCIRIKKSVLTNFVQFSYFFRNFEVFLNFFQGKSLKFILPYLYLQFLI